MTVIKKPIICRIFDFKAAWGINALLIVVVIALRLASGEYKRITKVKHCSDSIDIEEPENDHQSTIELDQKNDYGRKVS